MSIRYISLFSGIECASVAARRLEWTPICFAEIDPFASAVLAHHYPDVPNVGDMTRHDWSQYRGKCDLVVGGPPCQAFSVSGHRRSLDDARGNLTLVFAEAVDDIDPKIVVWENVPGVLSVKDNAYGCLVAQLAGHDRPIHPRGGRWTNAGMVTGPRRNLAWRVLDAQYFGVPQRRRRVYLVGCARSSGIDPSEILFEQGGLRRNIAAGQGKGKDVAESVAYGPAGGGEDGTGRGTPIMVANADGTVGVTLTASNCSKQANNQMPLVAFHGSQDPDVSGDVTHPVGRNQGMETCVAYCIQQGQLCRQPHNGPQGKGWDEEVCATIGATHHAHAVALTIQQNQAGELRTGNMMGTLNTNSNASSRNTPKVMAHSAVRRLTPRECERLQGLPDDYTLVPYRGKPAADGPRYRAIGNGMAVPVIEWMFRRIAKVFYD
ncbi:MAG: DNA cytosine methyltransferase [Planctomycetota bacterium]|jgi:DNA (cytosine-5)-methyltransferase 1|nr:DNA cytosine methyltransferase [Planctomycetota bacterium]